MKSFTASAVRAALIVSPISFFSTSVYASAWQIWEQSASSLGVAHADMASGAYDASTAYYNPAGMTRFDDPQVALGGEAVDLVSNVNYGTTIHGTIPITPPITIPSVELGDVTSHPTGGAFVPFFHAIYPLNNIPGLALPNMAVGLSVVSPYDVESNYNGYPATTYARKTKINSFLINPSIALEIWQGLSLGLGLDIQKAIAEASASVNVSTVELVNADAKVDAWDTGWNIGLLYELNDFTRFGFTYRAQISQHLTGHSKLEVNSLINDVISPSVLGSQEVPGSIDLNLPAVYSGGVYIDVSEDWAIMANVAYTIWNTTKDLTITNEEPIFLDGVPINQISVPMHLKNSFFYSVGATYVPADRWLMRGGIGYDQTPTRDEYRELRVPDVNRLSFAIGLGYEITEDLNVDLAYEYIYGPSESLHNQFLFVDTPIINVNDFLEYTGTVKGYANIFGAQLNYSF
jgi:long-chain fatty acid transport protein